MNIKELKAKSTEELGTELTALLKERFNLRIQRGSGQQIKTHLLRQIRRNIARIKTILTQGS